MTSPHITITKVVPVVSATPDYASGDSMGGLLTIPNVPRSGVIQSVTIVDLAKQSLAIDVMFFDRNPSATTFTDNGALTVADADLAYLIGVVNVAAGDFDAFADNSAATVSSINLPYQIVGTGQNGAYNLYAHLVARGAHNLASTSDIVLGIGIISP